MKETYTLNWSNPISINELTYKEPVKKGVYIWGFKIEDNFIPYYVGEAIDIEKRIQEHVCNLLSGRYTIYHKEKLKNFYQFKNTLTSESDKVYQPNWPSNYHTFISGYEKLKEHIDYMVNTFHFIYAEIINETAAKFELKLLERECIFKIGKDKLANKRGGNESLINITHNNFIF